MTTDIISTTQAARLLGVGPTTVKRWADEGRLPSLRTVGGHRRFRRREVLALLENASPDPPEQNDLAERLLQLLSEQSDWFVLQSALLEARARHGSWAALADRLADLLELIGRRWEQGRLSVAQEHLITERLSRGLAACAAQIPVRAHAPRCILATAESDPHTLGLSLVELCAREAGWDCEWLGARTPTAELLRWIEAHRAEALVVSASSWSRDAQDLDRQHRQLARACQDRGMALLLGGEGAWPEQPEPGHRVHGFQQLHDLLTRLDATELKRVAS